LWKVLCLWLILSQAAQLMFQDAVYQHVSLTYSCVAAHLLERNVLQPPQPELHEQSLNHIAESGQDHQRYTGGSAPASLKSLAIFRFGRDSGISSTCEDKELAQCGVRVINVFESA
jgi:hypothetical protein